MAIEQRRIKGAFAPPTPTLPILDALNNAFVSIRTRHPEIPNVVLVVGTSSRTKLGHFHAQSWEGKAVNEIMLSGESLQRGAVDVFGTLLHEAAHAYADAQGIKDTSRQGRFHNAKFKEIGERFGLVLTRSEVIGWSVTSVPEATQKMYADEIRLIRKALKAYRVPTMPKPAKPKTTIRLATASGRKVTVPILFYEAGGIFDSVTGEAFLPAGEGE